MEAIDRFFAKYVFGFIATEIMRLGVTKHSVYNHGWLFAMFAIVYSISRWPSSVFTWVFGALAILFTVLAIVRTALDPDTSKATPSIIWRIVWLGLASMDVFILFVDGWSGFRIEDWVMNVCILTAEYALLIDKIPPRKVKQKKIKLAKSIA